MCGKHCYGSYIVTPGQSIWTHPYWPQPAHSYRQHSPTRAQLKGSSCSSAIPSSTRGMSFRTQLEECHMLNPYPELNLRDTRIASRPPGETALTIRRISSNSPLTLSLPRGGTHLVAKRLTTYRLPVLLLSLGVLNPTVRRHTNIAIGIQIPSLFTNSSIPLHVQKISQQPTRTNPTKTSRTPLVQRCRLAVTYLPPGESFKNAQNQIEPNRLVSPSKNSSPPSSSSEKPRNGYKLASPSDTGLHRQAVPPGNP
ncbi:hypothetical protein DEO72_LG5g939 [Vigna unguiculata]|uniref:Uncharacterized protein n=1 Tax=Vigna unguiculata TaxID=3917 RepID=A0A4D6LWL8_VIGUN|nr:hypothetical protein DEO72_LG5g939 [Vigna unguiculata]